MIDKAQDYVWATARVLEQRRFEYLFGDGGDPAAVKAALEPYKTPDGGYGYALEPDGRGPTSQPPHIWTALEVLEELGETDPGIGDHLATLTAPDGGVPGRAADLEPYAARAVVGHRHRGHAARHRADLRAARRRPSVEGRRRGVLLDARSRRSRRRTRTRSSRRSRSWTPRPTASARRAQAERLGTLVREQNLVGTQPEGYSPGEIHHPHNFASSPGHRSPARGSATPRSRPASITSRPSSASTAAGRSRGRTGCPRSRSSGAGW